MPITVAPASASARANSRWLLGKKGSTKTTFMPRMVDRDAPSTGGAITGDRP